MIEIIKADGVIEKQCIENLKSRSDEVQQEVHQIVETILRDVKKNGDKALFEYTANFDGVNIKDFQVTKEEIEEAVNSVDKDFLKALNTAKNNIWFYHENQKQRSWMVTKEDGVLLGQQVRPLKKVGLYVPGGTAAYPSSVLMNAIPAKVAGVENIVMVTPPSKDGKVNPNILAAAKVAGVDQIFKIGGAQAIGALAYGTESIPKVDKIVGPGNIYVATAKRNVYGNVDIDMIAGPSEILIVADKDANAEFIAADLMSQAEHDVLSSAILITDDMNLAYKVREELNSQLKSMSRKDIITRSIEDYGAIIVTRDIKESLKLANDIAPEHLELMVKEPMRYLGDVENAGSIFLGAYAPEPLGDYIAGPNHVLPTSGTARFFSPLSVDSFIKKSSYLYYTEEAFLKIGNEAIKLAETEGLTAHANSLKVRLK
ncbi:MAG: histidinol dehydrogenase [Clostridiales bacterium]|uniref:histidinol dehydrogenase n=1 Tax=Clostridium sp. N3C TaxID=1776758 RepID=UPI00092DFB16|nr:histidinol dehydrogenase [Clostridium sp. N3C]NLZ48143.1 histidinol dehydrogenase [Clostridiales bacterium]SCN22535.1 Histidinol dehydrogenase [Clostridium sp. N3C]